MCACRYLMHHSGIVPNVNGRVVWPEPASASLCPVYVSGWQKRGPSGIIGTNKFDAEETIEQLLNDVSSGVVKFPDTTRQGFAPLASELRKKGVRWTTYEDWHKIDEEEKRRGKAVGKPREKMTSVEEMLKFLDKT